MDICKRGYRVTVLLTISTVIIIMLLWHSNIQVQLFTSGGNPKLAHEITTEELLRLVGQRNTLSRELNKKQQIIGQMECQIVSIDEAVLTNTSGKPVSTNHTLKPTMSKTGGWCGSYSLEHGGQHYTDKKLVPVLAEFFQGKSVGSFGDGPGRYKQMLLETGKLQSYDSFDGAPFSEKTSEGRVSFLDLSLPQYGLPLFDWVMSLEVVEHIPREFENIFLDNLTRHAREGIILSWGTPNQGGFGHVNGRTLEYVILQLERLGFKHDAIDAKRIQEACSARWLKKNINVYRRTNSSKIDMNSL